MQQLDRRILVVDDNRDVAETTAELLSLNDGCEVRVAYNGREAVEAARVLKPTIVVLDINMPVMDGYQAARILRAEETPGEPLLLIAVTGRIEPEDVLKARDAGFDHHLSKPLEVAELCELIEAFLEQSSTTAAPALSSAWGV